MATSRVLVPLGLLVVASCLANVDLGGSAPGLCHACTSDGECGAGAVCALFGGAAYCATLCPAGDECATGTACATLSTESLDETNACIPPSGTCSANPRMDAGLDGGDGGPLACATLAGPSVAAPCSACSTRSGDCQPNGCYNGWYCNLSYHHCQPPPESCDASAPNDGAFRDVD